MDCLRGLFVELRELTVEDARAVHRILGDDEVTRWLSFDSRSLEQCRDMLRGVVERACTQPRNEYYLAIVVSGEVVGFVRLGLTGVQAAKLWYAISAHTWGSGYATDAVRTMLAFGFDVLHLRRLSAAVGPTNHASLAVLKKAGMAEEGRLRDHVFTNGEWRDSLLLSLLKPEWDAGTTADW